MTKGTAVKIFNNIYSDEYEVEDKLTAIQEVTQMDTINGITKESLKIALTWLIEEYIY